MSRNWTAKPQGGSASLQAAEESTGSSGKMMMFQPSVKYCLPSDKKNLNGRILPAFDASMSPNDGAFLSSYSPYRDLTSGRLDSKTNTPEFTAWFTALLCHRFFGNDGYSFLSPMTLRLIGAVPPGSIECRDPLQDVRDLVYNKYKKEYEHLVYLERSKDPSARNEKAPFARATTTVAFNYHYVDLKAKEQKWETAVVLLSELSTEKLAEDLAKLTPRNATPHDKLWEDYLLGDITHPETGLVARVNKIKVGAMSTHGFVFSDRENELHGHTVYPVNEDVLKTRYNLFSSETLKILTYQEIVELVASQKVAPYDLLAEACSYNANVPHYDTKARTYSTPAASSEPAFRQERSAPASSAPAKFQHAIDDDLDTSPPPAPASAPSVEVLDAEFWVTGFGADKGTKPTKQKGAWVLGKLEEGLTGKVMNAVDRSGGWQDPAAVGIFIPVVEEEPPAPDDEEPPFVPDSPEDDAPPPPDDEPPSAPSVGVGSSGGLSPAEKAEYDRLSAKLKAKEPLTMDETGRLGMLMTRL